MTKWQKYEFGIRTWQNAEVIHVQIEFQFWILYKVYVFFIVFRLFIILIYIHIILCILIRKYMSLEVFESDSTKNKFIQTI